MKLKTKILLSSLITITLLGCGTYPPYSNSNDTDNSEKEIFSNFKLTKNFYSESDNLNEACKKEFGVEWRLADWNDLKNFYNNGGNLESLLDYLGMKYYPDRLRGDTAWISVNGKEFWNDSKHYYIERFNHETSMLCQYGGWPEGGCFLEHDNLDILFHWGLGG
jgi:hypothetical protein